MNMDAWLFSVAILRFAVTVLVTVELTRFRRQLNAIERIGLGLIGSGAFLTIPSVVLSGHERTPFDGWAPFVMTLGFLVYFAGRTIRLRRHDRANRQMVAQHEARMAAREAAARQG